MRSGLLIGCALVASTLSGVALAAPSEPAPPPKVAVVASPSRPQTPQNPAKIVRPSMATGKVPVVSSHTARLAAEHDQVKTDATRPIPTKLQIAKHEVLLRNQDINQTRWKMRDEADGLAKKAYAIAHPVVLGHDRWGLVQQEGNATPVQLAQASEVYVAAAQVSVKKAGNFSARVARDNPDPAAKKEAAMDMGLDYRTGARMYRESAKIEDQRANALEQQGKLPEAQLARDKAHNTRFVADRYERLAKEIEERGVPGADPE
jgi:hypothetical protein